MIFNKLYLTNEMLSRFRGQPIRWKETRSGREFSMPYDQVLHAELELNRLFVLRGAAYLNEFLELLGQRIDLSVDALGWDAIEGWENYGYSWIDFIHWSEDNGKVFYIDYAFPPHNILTPQTDEIEPPLGIVKYLPHSLTM